MLFRFRLLPLLFFSIIILSGCSVLKKDKNQQTADPEELPQEPPVVVAEEAPIEIPPPPPAPDPEEIKEYITRPKTPVMKEFRAAWLATLANINGPSKPGVRTTAQ